MKKCTRCSRDKTKVTFAKNQHWCTECKTDNQRRYRKQPSRKLARLEENRLYKAKHPEKVRTRRLLSTAVKKGEVKKKKLCELCGAKHKIEGHHPDYKYPLVVQWLCKTCHTFIHNNSYGLGKH